MAVDNQTTVDGICKGSEAGELILLVADHLDWSNEKEHLTLLQGKMNAYAVFVESKQYQAIYADEGFSKFVIQIMFLHEPSMRVHKFLDAAASYLSGLNISVATDTVS